MGTWHWTGKSMVYFKDTKRTRRRPWIGSWHSYDPAVTRFWPSFVRHPEPFAKRLEGATRRAARRFKARQRDLPVREYDDGYFGCSDKMVQ